MVQQTSILRVIGDKASGKSTYITVLATSSFPQADIIPLDSPTKALIAINRQILEARDQIVANDYGEFNTYLFQVRLKRSLKSLLNSGTFELQCKDYPGEFFQDLSKRINEPLLKQYIEDCAEATGILFLLDGTAKQDFFYSQCLSEFLNQLNLKTSSDFPKRKVAVVLSKCDLGELYIHRYLPEAKIEARFGSVYRKIKDLSHWEVDFFVSSAYGRLGHQNYATEPNCKIEKQDEKGTESVIKETSPDLWKPFGLIEPIYWLCTGNKL
jgi:GTPase SAR1 family protein